jgi:hypothetical protein
MTEKIIKICGKDVKLRYCAATETGFERITQKSIDVFSPKFGKDDEGNTIVTEKPSADTNDYIVLGASAIIAAYARNGEDAPVTTTEILYDATPTEITKLLEAVVALRNEWYTLPATIENEPQKSDESPKN